MGTTLPSDTPQKREYIDRWKEEGVEKAALSASVIKPTGYKYSLSLSLCYRQFDLDFKSAIISHVERYISIYPGNEEFLSRNLSFNPLTGYLYHI